jgi:hypothetical protein
MALDFSDFAVVYDVVMVALGTNLTEINELVAVEPFVTVVNRGLTDGHVRGVVRSASGAILADSANLVEAPPFDLVQSHHFEVWGPQGLEPGALWFQVFTTSATLVPSIDLSVIENQPDGPELRHSSGACYPGDFAVTQQRVRVVGGIVVPIGGRGARE